jgi:hypothetical protein
MTHMQKPQCRPAPHNIQAEQSESLTTSEWQLEEKDPLLRLGCSYSPYLVRLWIQDMKNYYVDLYRFASKHVHLIP